MQNNLGKQITQWYSNKANKLLNILSNCFKNFNIGTLELKKN